MRDSFEAFVARGPARAPYGLPAHTGPAPGGGPASDGPAKAWSRGRGSTPSPRRTSRILVNTYSSWWRRRWNGESPTDAPDVDHHDRDVSRCPSSGRPSPAAEAPAGGHRAGFFEDLTEAETARFMDCSVGTSRARPARRSPSCDRPDHRRRTGAKMNVDDLRRRFRHGRRGRLRGRPTCGVAHCGCQRQPMRRCRVRRALPSTPWHRGCRCGG